jgi:hypothetical protein
MAPNSVRSVEVAYGSKYSEATRNASSIAELIQTIPQTWRPALGAVLTSTYKVATKLSNVQTTIAQYDRHAADGSFPRFVRDSIKDPKVQFSKEYLNAVGTVIKEELDSHVKKVRKELLSLAHDRKKLEVAELQKLSVFDKNAWRTAILEVAERTADAFGSTVSGDNSSEIAPLWTGIPPTDLKEDCTALWKHGDVYHFRAISIARSLNERTLLDRMKSVTLKKDTDHEMKDADLELSTREVVRNELQTQIRLLKADLVKTMGTSSGKRQGSPLTLNRHSKKSRKCQERQTRAEPLWRQKGNPTQETKTEGAEQETRVITTQAFLSECSKEFRPWLGGTYPLVYNSLSLDTRMKIDVALKRTWEVDTIRASRPGVFQHTDVTLPEDIEYMLAVNHKFILPQDPTKHDVKKAAKALVRSVRIKWHFRNHPNNSEFIPKFHVANPYWKPPKASTLIERGLDAAVELIDGQINRAVSTIATQPKVHRLRWTKVRDYLEDNHLLAKLTDKNLGLAVIPVEWYDATILQMLADDKVYRHVQSVPAKELLDKLMTQVKSWDLPYAMEKYIIQKTDTVMPEFHAIPKVHKNPWKLRPIVPSHSWVTTTTSEVLDHLCQPLLKLFPWIVASSKEVLQQIEKIQVPTNQPIWIVTGDVEAFYSNIPIKNCAKTLAHLWGWANKDSTINKKTIRGMVTFVMENNYLAYRGQHFHQLNGLAMGTSCAPVLANIYAAYYEKKARVIHQDGVLLYVRYIDDILMLFQGSREELMEWQSRFSIGPLTINWQIHDSRNEFLDIELIKEPGNFSHPIKTKLFRKSMNRHLYIPWSSAHPEHVKKGFVKAELTRYIMLSSHHEYFADARKELYSNLRRRGYPPEKLAEWFQQVQYSSRPTLLLDKPITEDKVPLMLPGHYNPVWEYINAKEVISAARRFWVKEELPDTLEEPLIRSLGRTTSLFDLLSAWNKTTLLLSSDD